ncbi:MAG: radical SAM protein [Candidatus Eisenbacteria bacterium]|nr:radical SAM protein [Candidatus Eisenbacteria bacterium]
MRSHEKETATTHQIDLPPYRPPSEAHSVLLRVTRGCPWNRCAFCGMYKQLRFEVRELEEIYRDIDALREIWPQARSVFLADSDALVHPRRLEIVRRVRAAFPEAERITSYSRLSTLRRLSPEKMRDLREAGLTRVHAGLESGSARVLERACKGITPAQAIAGGRRAVEAGFSVCLYVLCGLGGEEDWEEHARETARVIAALRPQFVRLRSLALLPETPLREAWEAGRFVPIAPITRLRETRLLVERLSQLLLEHGDGSAETPAEIEIVSDHFTNQVWVDAAVVYEGIHGRVPREQARLLAILDHAIDRAQRGRRTEDIGSLALRRRIPQL